MASKSKSKGNRFEYELRDLLNSLYDSEEFARTPGSGAIMGRGNFVKRQGLAADVQNTLACDLITPDWFPFAIEAKSYADQPNYSRIISSTDSHLDKWLGEVCFDARNFNLIPLLFFKTTRKGTHAALPYSLIESLNCFPNKFLKYGDFIIFGIDQFIEINQHLRDTSGVIEDVVKWLETSDHVISLIESLQSKTKKASK